MFLVRCWDLYNTTYTPNSATVKKPHRLIQLKMSSSSNVMRFTLQRSANRIMRTFTLIRMKKKCDETRR